jgi:RND family efflux transporter MFP subunit
MMRGIVATIVIVGALAVVFVLAQSGTFTPKPTPSPDLSPSQSPRATPTLTPTNPPTPRPSATPVDTSVTASANVVPIRSADLATRLSGIVNSLYVNQGSQAESGQLLLKLDQRSYLAAVNEAEAQVGQAEASVAQLQLQLEQLPPDASPGQIASVQASLRVAEAQLELARANVESAQTALQQTEVRAPFAGTIASVDVEVGEQAIAGDTVISIGDLTAWLIETTDLSELQVVRLAIGDRAEVTFEARPALTLVGTVDRIQLRGTSSDGGIVYAVGIRPDVHHPELLWGMSATVRITPSG